jgi:hypothetical protein
MPHPIVIDKPLARRFLLVHLHLLPPRKLHGKQGVGGLRSPCELHPIRPDRRGGAKPAPRVVFISWLFIRLWPKDASALARNDEK